MSDVYSIFMNMKKKNKNNFRRLPKTSTLSSGTKYFSPVLGRKTKDLLDEKRHTGAVPKYEAGTQKVLFSLPNMSRNLNRTSMLHLLTIFLHVKIVQKVSFAENKNQRSQKP